MRLKMKRPLTIGLLSGSIITIMCLACTAIILLAWNGDTLQNLKDVINTGSNQHNDSGHPLDIFVLEEAPVKLKLDAHVIVLFKEYARVIIPIIAAALAIALLVLSAVLVCRKILDPSYGVSLIVPFLVLCLSVLILISLIPTRAVDTVSIEKMIMGKLNDALLGDCRDQAKVCSANATRNVKMFPGMETLTRIPIGGGCTLTDAYIAFKYSRYAPVGTFIMVRVDPNGDIEDHLAFHNVAWTFDDDAFADHKTDDLVLFIINPAVLKKCSDLEKKRLYEASSLLEANVKSKCKSEAIGYPFNPHLTDKKKYTANKKVATLLAR